MNPHAAHSIDEWRHPHAFVETGPSRAERRVWIVVAVTAVAMVVEIAAGLWTGSMALLADGWHMATHAGAMSLAAAAYVFARAHARNPRFAFGTGKVGDLTAFASALSLGFVALLLVWESVARLIAPAAIAYDEALVVAVAGLVVNVVCAAILGHGHTGHHHGHAHGDHEHHEHERDHNFSGAYLHVIADAATSVAAIAGLFAGRELGLSWADPALGVLGALIILRWAYSLARDSGGVLLDAAPAGLSDAVHAALETGDDRVADVHVWRVAPGHLVGIVSIVSARPQPPAAYKAKLDALPALQALTHLTVEVNACTECGDRPEGAVHV